MKMKMIGLSAEWNTAPTGVCWTNEENENKNVTSYKLGVQGINVV